MEIVLGTAQIGLDYGINNHNGKIKEEEAFNILDYAHRNGINEIDTADFYGNALEILNKYGDISKNRFRITSKFFPEDNAHTLTEALNSCLKRIGVDYIDTYLFHHYETYQSYINLKNEGTDLKLKKIVKKIGVSLYNNSELKRCIEDEAVDVIQLPFNILDSHEEKITLMKKAHEKGKKVYVRSIFLQGLFYKEPESLTGNLKAIKPVLNKVATIRKESLMSVEELCISYVKSFNFIDGFIMGVDSLNQLKYNLDSCSKTLPVEVKSKLQKIYIKDKELLNPSKWKI